MPTHQNPTQCNPHPQSRLGRQHQNTKKGPKNLLPYRMISPLPPSRQAQYCNVIYGVTDHDGETDQCQDNYPTLILRSQQHPDSE
ncbi:hypothetical protein L873DRAFT_1851391 [Choiromyces venosus 120613-1]|uniref:Uncharacterized protein n=1 Tax=Choiromyces venosus 120613-1 TaxID=1336337 RepID=A0A3N4K9V1_9PEZI|nr:hypothetical protein L873DRAFT_1851391 [Choiromyces venosus 120613-1]